MRFALLTVSGLLALALAGCPEPTDDEIELYAFTGAPPGRTATVTNLYDPDEHDIDITRGVTIGVGCWDTCDYYCQDPTVTSGDDSLIRIRKVYRASTTTTQFVLIAVATGNTQVTVRTACAERIYPVHILED